MEQFWDLIARSIEKMRKMMMTMKSFRGISTAQEEKKKGRKKRRKKVKKKRDY